ncbi:MAG: slipin family protein [Cellulosilyticaceae bacterium]
MKQIIVRGDEVGLWYKDGTYEKHVKAGRYRIWQPSRIEVKVVRTQGQVETELLEVIRQDTVLSKMMECIRVADHELVMVFEDQRLCAVLTSGEYGFWKFVHTYTVERISLDGPTVEARYIPYMDHALLEGKVCRIEVAPYERGVLYLNHSFEKILEPGCYNYWNGITQVSVKMVDLREKQIEINGQEILTEDKVSLRMNFICRYRISDVLQCERIDDLPRQLYTELQLVLREYVGMYPFDELLKRKREIADFVMAKMDLACERFGTEIISAGVKDLILPGDMKEIFNCVLLAEKQAQASLIARREEVASTRSLLNTARLMDENHTLYKLKELEYLQKICENIGELSVMGSGTIVELLTSLLESRGNHERAIAIGKNS